MDALGFEASERLSIHSWHEWDWQFSANPITPATRSNYMRGSSWLERDTDSRRIQMLGGYGMPGNDHMSPTNRLSARARASSLKSYPVCCRVYWDGVGRFNWSVSWARLSGASLGGSVILWSSLEQSVSSELFGCLEYLVKVGSFTLAGWMLTLILFRWGRVGCGCLMRGIVYNSH